MSNSSSDILEIHNAQTRKGLHDARQQMEGLISTAAKTGVREEYRSASALAAIAIGLNAYLEYLERQL